MDPHPPLDRRTRSVDRLLACLPAFRTVKERGVCGSTLGYSPSREVTPYGWRNCVRSSSIRLLRATGQRPATNICRQLFSIRDRPFRARQGLHRPPERTTAVLEWVGGQSRRQATTSNRGLQENLTGNLVKPPQHTGFSVREPSVKSGQTGNLAILPWRASFSVREASVKGLNRGLHITLGREYLIPV